MINDVHTELPEQRMTRELMRISAELQQSGQGEHSLVDLFEVLINFDHEIDGDAQAMHHRRQQFSEPSNGSLHHHRLSMLVEMLQETQTRLRSRALNLAERLEVYDASRQANACYENAAHWERVLQTPRAFRDTV